MLRAHSGALVGSHCPGAKEEFKIQGLSTRPAPEVHRGALEVSFTQVYMDSGAETQWRGILPDGKSVLERGTWKGGGANGAFVAHRVGSTAAS